MNIAYLTHDTPDVFYRVGQYLDYLHFNDISTSILRTPRDFYERLHTFKTLSYYDVVVIQRKLFNAFWRILLKKYARSLVLDIDDAIMFSSDESNFHSRTRLNRYEKMVGLCDHIIVGNGYLRDVTCEICPSAHVTIIPTVVNLRQYPVKDHLEKRSVVIGWIGSASTIKYLDLVQSVLREIISSHENVIFRIVSNEFPDWEWAEKKKWARKQEIKDVLDFDIGIMPLNDNPWTRGKCGFKLIQYMAAGLPVVASPVGANNDIVEHGHNGFLAETRSEWAKALSNLVADRDLRVSLGINGRRKIENEYSVGSNAPSYLSTIMNAAVTGTDQA
ncbi:MAG: glycosyltransferase family 4 protein [Desulfomonilia bacterium]